MWLIYTLSRPLCTPHFAGIIGPDDNSENAEPDGTLMQIFGTAKTYEEAEQHRAALAERYNIKPPPPVQPLRTAPVTVRCITTGIIYANMTQAAKANRVSRSHLLRHLNNSTTHPAAKGLRFERI